VIEQNSGSAGVAVAG